MRKKTILVAALASAIALMFSGPASAAVTRTVTQTYNFPAVGQGDLGGVCFNQDPTSTVPPQFWSCLEFEVEPGEISVDVTVTDNEGNPVFISIQQDGNNAFDAGCGTILNFPVVDSGPGGTAAEPVVVFPWPGPAANPSFNPPGVDPCEGSVDTTGGTGTATFHDAT